MNGKILAGLFVIIAMAGIGFAWYGFNGEIPEDVDREAMKENRETCMGCLASEEAALLKTEMKEAREAGDEEKIAELKEQIMEHMPEGCRPPMHGKPGMFGKRMMESLPEDVKEEFKTAMENKDFETLRALKEEYFPKPPFGPEKPEMMN